MFAGDSSFGDDNMEMMEIIIVSTCNVRVGIKKQMLEELGCLEHRMVKDFRNRSFPFFAAFA